MVTKRQNSKNHSVSAIFLLFIQFSATEMRLVFSHAKQQYDKLITMTGKKAGVPVLVGELESFFN